jgi:cardiolipin synthase
MQWGVGLLAVVAVAACAPPAQLDSVAAPVPITATSQIGPDSVEVFTDGTVATAALVDAVTSAQVSVDAEIYEFDRPDLVGAMIAATSRGVRVRVVADPTVPVTVTTGHRLAAAGAMVAFFPVGPRQIDHVKLMLVDGARAYFGGYNWGSRSYLNRDYEVAMMGPAVARLEGVFADDLARSGQPAGPPASDPQRPDEPLLLTSFPSDDVGRAVVSTLGSARHSIKIEMFVMTDTATMAALEAARGRGVDVQVLFDPGQDLNQVAMVRLRAAGIRCRFYRTAGEKLHAKVAVVDGDHLILGSANWTASGFRHNHELDIVLVDPVLAGAVRARMDVDWLAAG